MENTTLTSRFVNFHTRAAYNTFKAGAGNAISDQSIVFITDPDASQRDILTHGISMIGGVPRISSYSVDGGAVIKPPKDKNKNVAELNLNFISGKGVALSADEKGVKISCDLPIEKGTGVASLKANSGNSAKGASSFAEGIGTQTLHDAEHASGKFNVSHNNADKFTDDHADGTIGTAHTVYSIGGGTSDTDRKNLFEVMDNGDIYILFKGKYRRLQTLLDDTFTVSDDSVFTIISDSK